MSNRPKFIKQMMFIKQKIVIRVNIHHTYTHIITPSVDYNQWLERLDTQLNKPSNQNSSKVPKVIKSMSKKTLLYNQCTKQPIVPSLQLENISHNKKNRPGRITNKRYKFDLLSSFPSIDEKVVSVLYRVSDSLTNLYARARQEIPRRIDTLREELPRRMDSWGINQNNMMAVQNKFQVM